MNIKKAYLSVEQSIGFIMKWAAYVSFFITAFTTLLQIFEWGRTGPFSFLVQNLQLLWFITVTLAVLVLWIWVTSLYRRFVQGFSDNFKGNLEDNWDFIGPWRIAEKGTLLVTGSDEGGITKVGALWENYTLSFKTRIISDCLGVIVRAQDIHNYYMFQISPDKIRPHRRVAVPVIIDEVKKQNKEGTPQPRPINYFIGWQTDEVNPDFKQVPLNPKLDGWFNVRVVVRGQSVRIYIDDNLVLQRSSFLQIPYGKVGFRNHGSEEAYIRDVKVTLQS